MKHFKLLCLILLVSQQLFAQKIIDNPGYAFSTAGGLRIVRIERNETSTICQFEYSEAPGASYSIPDKTYIKPTGSETKLFVTKAENVALNQWASVPSSGKVQYTLHFPAIDPACKSLEFGEGNEGGGWFIYEIELEKKPYKGAIAQNLSGYWYKTDGSKELVVALYDTVALYQNQLWKYGKVETAASKTTIELANSTGKQTFVINPVDTETILFETSKQNKWKLSKTPQTVQGYSNPNDKPYTAPVFVRNGEATYKGYIRNFNPKYISQKSGQIHVNNVITGNQDTYNVKIANDGTFSVSFPMAYPSEIYVQMLLANEAIFVEPGKTTFHIIDNSSSEYHLFMGDLAVINNGFMAVKNIRNYDYNKAQDSILSFTPKQFMDYCLRARDLDMKQLEQYAQANYLSAKVLQIKQKCIVYQALSSAMEYRWIYESAYRQKNNIPRDKRDVVIDIPKFETSYYSFLNNQLANDPLAPLSNGYGTFINRIKYINQVQSRSSYSIRFSSIEKLAKETGLSLTTEELQLIAKGKLTEEEPEIEQKRMALYLDNQSVVGPFRRKHQDLLKVLQKSDSFMFEYDLLDTLLARGIEVASVEKDFLTKLSTLKPREEMVQFAKINKEFSAENGEAVKALFAKYKDLTEDYSKIEDAKIREHKFKELFNVDKGLATDIMYAQDLCRGIVEEATPVEAQSLNRMLALVSTPFIKEFVANQNEKTKERLAANKMKTGYAVNLAPSVEADKLFDAMLEKFKGKVVFVDFWATWCGPCRSGIERMKPLKEEMAGKDIVFLYITGPSSPEATWSNMIPDIGGEHYRVNTDEWNTICGKFNISGIPHYALVDKNGVVAKNNGMPEHDLNAMKKMFEEFMAK
jgi:thiol-disulfide isomerase/thioredoxin